MGQLQAPAQARDVARGVVLQQGAVAGHVTALAPVATGVQAGAVQGGGQRLAVLQQELAAAGVAARPVGQGAVMAQAQPRRALDAAGALAAQAGAPPRRESSTATCPPHSPQAPVWVASAAAPSCVAENAVSRA